MTRTRMAGVPPQSDAGVTNAHARVLGLQLHRQRDFATVKGVLRSVHEEICEHLFYSAAVGIQPQGIIWQVDRELVATPGDVLFDCLNRLLYEEAQIDSLALPVNAGRKC